MIDHYLDTNYKVIHNTIIELPCNPKWTTDVVQELGRIFSINEEEIKSILKEWCIDNGFDMSQWDYSYACKKINIHSPEEYIKFLDIENNPFLTYYSMNNRLDFNMINYFEPSRKSAIKIFECDGLFGPILFNYVDNGEVIRGFHFFTEFRYIQEENRKTNPFWEQWLENNK